MYGYDIRGEVFGSGGMVTMSEVRRSSMTLFENGTSNDTWRRDTEHFVHGYTAQLASFVSAVRRGELSEGPGGVDARNALAIALACIESISKNAPVPLR